jgi:hypothetical protein
MRWIDRDGELRDLGSCASSVRATFANQSPLTSKIERRARQLRPARRSPAEADAALFGGPLALLKPLGGVGSRSVEKRVLFLLFQSFGFVVVFEFGLVHARGAGRIGATSKSS